MHRSRLFQSVAQQIIELIQNGSFKPGSHLPNERDFAAQLGVSRSTLREAEIALEATGWIAIRTSTGAFVTEREPQFLGDISRIDEMSALEALLFVGSEMAALAVSHITDEDLITLGSLQVLIAAADEAAFRRLEVRFYLTIAISSNNSALAATLQPLLQTYERAAAPWFGDVKVQAEYITLLQRGLFEILEALRDRNPFEARARMRRHFRDLIAFRLDVSEELALAEVRRCNIANRQRYLTKAGDAHS